MNIEKSRINVENIVNYRKIQYTYRKICVNDYCYIYNTNCQVYKFNLTGIDSLKIYKPVFNQKHLENEQKI